MAADSPTAAACSNVRSAGFLMSWVSVDACVFGERAVAPPEHLVARPEALHVAANGLDGAGDIGARNWVLRLAQAGDEAHDERRARHQDPVADMDRRRVDANEDLVVGDLGLVDLARGENVGRPVLVLNDCQHDWTPLGYTV